MRWTKLRGIGIGVVGLVFCSIRAEAQLRVQVVDAEGQGVAEATVEVWSPVRLLGAYQTDPDGEVVLAAKVIDAANKLRVRRIGFRPVRIVVAPDDRTIVARLEPMAIVPAECVPGEVFPEYAAPGPVRPDRPVDACPPVIIRASGRGGSMLTARTIRS